MQKYLPNDWMKLLSGEFEKEYFRTLSDRVEEEYLRYTVFPPKEEVFSAFNYVLPQEVKVVIFGQDPYHEAGQAHGLAFSVREGVKIPPSLKNIYKELSESENITIPETGFLEKWAKQGVLLLNSVLTVREGEAASHAKFGWRIFTDAVISRLNTLEQPIVFMLWGNYSKEKQKLLNNEKHLVLTAAHPSPLSANRGFFGCGHFSAANDFLRDNGISTVDWQI